MLDEVEGRGQPGRFLWCAVLLTWPVLFPASSALTFEYIVLLPLSRKLGCHCAKVLWIIDFNLGLIESRNSEVVAGGAGEVAQWIWADMRARILMCMWSHVLLLA